MSSRWKILSELSIAVSAFFYLLYSVIEPTLLDPTFLSFRTSLWFGVFVSNKNGSSAGLETFFGFADQVGVGAVEIDASVHGCSFNAVVRYNPGRCYVLMLESFDECYIFVVKELHVDGIG